MKAKKMLLLGLLALAGCSSSPDEGNGDTPAADTTPARKTIATTSSQANAYAKNVSADLDVTTYDQFFDQMPKDMPHDTDREGENRIFTWTFADGSKIIATFRPKGGEGSQQGLLLYMIDIT